MCNMIYVLCCKQLWDKGLSVTLHLTGHSLHMHCASFSSFSQYLFFFSLFFVLAHYNKKIRSQSTKLISFATLCRSSSHRVWISYVREHFSALLVSRLSSFTNLVCHPKPVSLTCFLPPPLCSLSQCSKVPFPCCCTTSICLSSLVPNPCCWELRHSLEVLEGVDPVG